MDSKRPGSLVGGEGEVEELEHVLKALSSFMEDLGPLISRIVTSLIEAYPGEKIGKEVASFYRKLIDEGVPEELAVELTRKYFDSLNLTGKISEMIGELRKKY